MAMVESSGWLSASDEDDHVHMATTSGLLGDFV